MTAGSSPSSSRAGGGAALALVALGAACVEHREREHGTTSLAVEVTAPADLGTPTDRLPEDQRDLTVTVTALDELGQEDRSLSAPLRVYLEYLGTLTPFSVDLTLASGTASASFELPLVFGPTVLWIEDTIRADASYATGTSATLWYRDPYLDDISRPEDESLGSALFTSPLEGKQVRVGESKFGEAGRLVITAVYAQGYTLSDVDCTTLPCVADPYGHVFVYTYQLPRAEDGTALKIGHHVDWVGGGVSEFNGFTELGFPQTSLVPGEDPDEDYVPEPVVLDPAWLMTSGRIELERLESGLVEVAGATVCPLDDDFTTYSQWKLDVGLGCETPFNVISAGAAPGFDPAAHEGEVLPHVVGTLRAVNIGSFNVWIVYARRDSDLITP